MCSADESSGAHHVGIHMTEDSSDAAESPETNWLKWKKLARGSKKSLAFKKQRAHEQPIAKDRVIHTNKSAYATTLLKVENLKHSALAYTGNLTKQDEVSLPPELGCGYRRLKYIAG